VPLRRNQVQLSAWAKGRVERSFGTAQDRLVKGLRVAGVKTLEEANRYLETEFLPWWNQHLVVQPASPVDAHRPLGPEHDLAATLSHVETRQAHNDYTIQFEGRFYQIERASVCAGLRGSVVRVERRLDGKVAVRFRERYLEIRACPARPQPPPPPPSPPRHPAKPQPSAAMRASMDTFLDRPGRPVWSAAKIDKTRTSDRLED
jgi:hypothetical protein